MVKCLLLGANGTLANCLSIYFQSIGVTCVGVSRGHINTKGKYSNWITSNYTSDNLKYIFEKIQPDLVVNTIAEINLSKCQNDFLSAYKANVEIPHILQEALSNTSKSLYMVHISTDNIYSKPGLSSESDELCVNNYAFSKLMGELAFQSNNALVLRTNFLVKTSRMNTYFDWVLSTAQSNNKIQLYGDVKFTPTLVTNIGENILHGFNNHLVGTYNLGISEPFTKADFHLNVTKELNPLYAFEVVNTPQDVCPRPLDMAMDSRKALDDGFNVISKSEFITKLMGEKRYEF